MNAELLLMFSLNCDRAYLFAHPERELTAEEESSYEAALAERSRGVPAQYITGHQEFWGMDLIVTPAVLIPRPETERLTELILSQIPVAMSPGTRLADIGTGSGVLAITLALERPSLEIVATDLSADTLALARENANVHEVDGRITWVILNRPEKRNAMNPTLNAEMVEVLETLDADDACGVVVLTGAGEAFSAGMDLKEYFREVDAGPEH